MTLSLFPGEPIPTKPPIALRPYQDKGIVRIRELAWTKRRILVVGPCAMGKMFLVANIFRTATCAGLFVCHRQELINQCVRELARQGITQVGVIRADDERTNAAHTIQVASVQTLARRDKPPAKLIFIDEAHRSLSDQYEEHVFNAYPDAIIIGLTATPVRLDGRPMGSRYDHLEIITTYQELLKNPDWLVAPDIYSAPIVADLSGVQTVGSDYDETQLAEVMSQQVLVGQLLDHWLKLAHLHPVFHDGERTGKVVEGERRRTFIFAVNIAHSESICERFEKAGVRIAHLDGKTPDAQRKAMLRDLETGKLEAISNCNVLLEGTDIVPAKCVAHARPTQSLVLHRQSCGRIFRPWQGVIPLILDHASNFDRHGAPHEDLHWSLTNRPRRISSQAPAKICRGCFAYVPSGRLTCPYCGYVFPEGSMKTPQETHAELLLRSTDPEDMKKQFFDKMVGIARARGFKPGFASAKFKERYGTWAPYAWSDPVKSGFLSDEFWQKNFQRREDNKQQIAAEEAKAEARHTEHAAVEASANAAEADAAHAAAENENQDPFAPFGENPPPVDQDPWELTSGLLDDQEESFADWVDREAVQR